MRSAVLVLVVFAANGRAQAPCVVAGDGELPQGTLSVGGVEVGRPIPFESRHRIAISFPRGDLTIARPVRIENARATIALELSASETISAVMKKGGLRFGVWVPNKSADAKLVGADEKGLQLEFPDLKQFKGIAPRGHAPCGAVEFRGSRRGRPEGKDPPGVLVMIAKGEVAIAETFNGPDVGSLIVPVDAIGVMLGVKGKRAHLVWTVDDGAFDGWVPSNALSLDHGAWAMGGGSLEGKGNAIIELTTSETIRCRDPVKLFARVGGKQLALGTLNARTPFLRVKDSADAIQLGLEGVRLNAGVELTIDWAGCVR